MAKAIAPPTDQRQQMAGQLQMFEATTVPIAMCGWLRQVAKWEDAISGRLVHGRTGLPTDENSRHQNYFQVGTLSRRA
jgi:hypothetical protein